MPDLKLHTVSWVAGFVYVGNGTLGANDSVYFRSNTSTYVVPGLIAIAGSDPHVGASYVKALSQLYRRKVYRKIKARFQAIQSSTTNNMTLTAAPVRGPPGKAELALGTTGTGAAVSQLNVMSLSGSKTCDSFENLEIDLTPYIAGGSGASQNEFQIADFENASGDSVVLDPMDVNGSVPCSFVVSGNSTVSALRGTNTHMVVIETQCDFLDFVGAVPALDPIALAKIVKKTC